MRLRLYPDARLTLAVAGSIAPSAHQRASAAPSCSRSLLLLCRIDALEIEALDQLASATDADLIEDVRQVVLYRVFGDEERGGDLPGGCATHHQLNDFALSRAQIVGGGLQPGQVRRTNRR